MKKKNRKKNTHTERSGSLSIGLGLCMIAAAISLTAYNLSEDQKAGESAQAIYTNLQQQIQIKQEVKQQEQQKPEGEESIHQQMPQEEDYEKYPDMEMPTQEVEGNRYLGVLEIPELGLSLPVMGGEWNYDKLRISPCCYQGSVYQDNMILAAHNYTRHFGKLRRLSIGSKIRFTDMDGNVFHYEVGWVEILAGTAVDAMTEGEDWDLTLFTCVYSGRSRYTVRCIRIEE